MSGRKVELDELAVPAPLLESSDRGKGVPSFDEMVAIVFEEVDFDDPTTNM